MQSHERRYESESHAHEEAVREAMYVQYHAPKRAKLPVQVLKEQLEVNKPEILAVAIKDRGLFIST